MKSEYHKDYYQENRVKLDKVNQLWAINHKEAKNKYNRNKCLIDVNFKLKRRLRRTIYGYIKNKLRIAQINTRFIII